MGSQDRLPCKDAPPESPPGPGAQAILRVAEALVAEKGFDAVSVNDIAREASVSKANVFHHFKSKEGLYLEVLRHACRHSARALDAALAESSADPHVRLQQFFFHHLRALLEHAQSSRLLQRALLEGASQRGRELAEEVFAHHFSRLVELVRAGQSSGCLRRDFDPALLAFLLVGASAFFFETRAVLRHLPEVTFAERPERYGSAVFDLLARGFARAPGEVGR
ncbi:MAG: TetR/AcrR family transcriptional regulator [Gammaproteobacteria bacterium]|nr:MAG: TetR/AcrR family transcriptional regulator [Gammaproteobacteria bacterium]